MSVCAQSHMHEHSCINTTHDKPKDKDTPEKKDTPKDTSEVINYSQIGSVYLLYFTVYSQGKEEKQGKQDQDKREVMNYSQIASVSTLLYCLLSGQGGKAGHG